MKKISLIILLFFSVSLPAYAAETPITKSEVFETETSDFIYDFQEEIEENGSKYKLSDVRYKTISQKEETETVHKTEEVYIEDLYEQSVDPEKTKQIIIDGERYDAALEDIRYEDIVISDRKAEVETTVKLPENSITNNYDYEYEDAQAKTKVKVTLTKRSQTATEETEEKNTVFPVVFHRYDSGISVINNKSIPVNTDGSPVDAQYFTDVKAESVYRDAEGRITAMEWDGASYTAPDGEVCRNASATLTETVKIYEVKYSDSVDLPDTEGYRAILTYGTDVLRPSGKMTYKVEAKALYELIPAETADHTALFIGIGVAVLALLAAVILFIIAKKKKSKKSEYKI